MSVPNAADADWQFCSQFWLRSAGFPFAPLDRLRLGQAVAAIDRALDLEGGRDAQASEAWQEAERLMAVELQAARATLREMADEQVRHAIFLSSPAFHETIGGHFAAPLGSRRSRARQKERTFARYLQRLHAKNDTVSFFGPLAWGRIDPSSEGCVDYAAGGALVARCLVSLEHWAAAQLARTISQDESVAEQLAPTLSPGCRLEGGTLYYPVGRSAEIDDRWRAVLEACTGRLPWARLIERLADHPAFATSGPSPTEVASELLSRRIIVREIGLPTAVARPEQLLRDRVAALAEPARGPWLTVVDWFCTALDEFQHADFDRRRALLDDINRRFTDVTGVPAERRAGEMYAARAVLYEDCERDVRGLRVGRALNARLAALAPLFELARWITNQLALRYEPAYTDVFERLAAGRPAVDFAQFMREAAWIGSDGAVEEQLRTEISDAWLAVLAERWPVDGAELHVSGADCAAVLERLAGGDSARGSPDGLEVLGATFHSPDLLLAATPAQVAADGGLIVLGELHKAVFLAAQPVALPFCPDPEALLSTVERAVDRAVLTLVDAPRAYQRSNMNWPDRPFFHEIVSDGATARFAGSRSVPIGAVEVTRENGHLYVATRDGSLRQRLFDVLGGTLQDRLLAIEPIELPGDPALGGATPRVVLDGIVVRRRRWTIESSLLDRCPAATDSAARLGWARRLIRQLGLSERIFVTSPSERKPIYVDLRNFFLVELLFKLAGEAPTLTITEMLPRPEELWLADGAGARYTAELRLTAFTRPRKVATGSP